MADAQRSLSGVLLVLLMALVWGQSLGVWHRVAHAQQSARVASHVVPVEVADDVSLLAVIWGDHSNSAECQLFDQTCPDMLSVPIWALPVVSALPTWLAVTLRERFALVERFYAARGPPAALL